MINLEHANDRSRLARTVWHHYNEQELYRASRRETVVNHAGALHLLRQFGGVGSRTPMWGNLIQMGALSHTISVAFSRPKYKVVANTPDAIPTVDRLQAFLNRYTELLGLDEITEQVGLDSFFGFGIIKVAEGMLSPAARMATGLSVGPSIWRISQDDFVWDGSATKWSDVSYMGDIFTVPLSEAQSFQPFLEYNPEDTLALTEHTLQFNRTDSILHGNAAQTFYTPQAMVRLIELYFPHSGMIATWAANTTSFNEISGKPLWVRPYQGHHSGPYSIVSHVKVPDNIIPAAVVDGTKEHHFLFNDLAETSAEAARSAKYNPIYEMGSNQDMDKLLHAKDRSPIGVSDITKISGWEMPGPRQDQTAYMHATLSMFKEFQGNLDDTLGLAPTSKTARQSQLIRSATTVRQAMLRRNMQKMMSAVGLKLGQLALTSPNLRLTIHHPTARGFSRNLSWAPVEDLPRVDNIDEFAVEVVPYSMEYQEPEARLQSIQEAVQAIALIQQLVQAGAPLDLAEFVEMQADYRDLPEIRRLYLDLMPEMKEQVQQAAKSSSAMDMVARSQKPNGDYTRHNVSERTNSGGMNAALAQAQSNPDPSQGGVG